MRDADLLPTIEPLGLIGADGRPIDSPVLTMPSIDRLREAYRGLVLGRRINDQCNALVRQGRLAVYPSSHGQEACEVALAQVLGSGDWLFPTYRDVVSIMLRGVEPEEALVGLRGDWHCGFDPRAHLIAPPATPLATQLLHAAGAAHAAQRRGDGGVVLTNCGDGATSEGDFHEALNFAAVFHCPVVFLVQNNGYAISVPLSRQTAAPSLAHKGIGYGIPGRRVDGNDVAALLAVLDEAIDRARRGEGPTLVEAITYRMQAHTNADDDTRYRDRDEVAQWAARDPLARMAAYLRSQNALDDEAAMAAEAEGLAARIRDAMNDDAPGEPDELFRHVHAEIPPSLAAQRALLQDELARA